MVVLGACGRIGFDGLASTDAGSEDTAADAPAFVGGSGNVSGVGCQNDTFSTVSAAYVVGHRHVDSNPEVYLFAQPVECGPAGIETMDWDTNEVVLAPLRPLQAIGLRVSDHSDGIYAFGFEAPPSPSRVYGAYYRIYDGGSAVCSSQVAGTLSITFAADGSADGTFAAQFAGATGSMLGDFHAVPCIDGWRATVGDD